MPSPPAGPLAVDLDVLKLGTVNDPVTFDDVERALYALTGWQKPQRLVDVALDVVEAYAAGRRAGRVVPQRVGHDVVGCHRAHLDGHECPVTVRHVEVEVPATCERPHLGEMPAVVAPVTAAPVSETVTVPDGTQTCLACQVAKPWEEFYRDRSRKVGYMARCKTCANAASVARRRAKREAATARGG